MQRHEVIKIWCILGMMDKINLQEWIDRLTKLLFTLLNYKPLMCLQETEINDYSHDKINSGSGFQSITRNK